MFLGYFQTPTSGRLFPDAYLQRLNSGRLLSLSLQGSRKADPTGRSPQGVGHFLPPGGNCSSERRFGRISPSPDAKVNRKKMRLSIAGRSKLREGRLHPGHITFQKLVIPTGARSVAKRTNLRSEGPGIYILDIWILRRLWCAEGRSSFRPVREAPSVEIESRRQRSERDFERTSQDPSYGEGYVHPQKIPA